MNELNCEKCGKKLNPKTAVTVELNFRTGEWYAPGACPPNESQGAFAVGPDCARKMIINLGNLPNGAKRHGFAA